jgi:vacuolar protein-sorting-associated protein 4
VLQALGLYKKSLEYFMAGLKYEKNPTTRNTIMVRVEGYMKRAETLSEILKSQSEIGKGGTSPGGAATASSSEKDKVRRE